MSRLRSYAGEPFSCSPELPSRSPDLPAAAYAAALACLPGVGPAWLVDALGRFAPERAWEAVLAGQLGPPARSRPGPAAPEWPEAARRLDVAALWARCERAGISVTWPGQPCYPTAFVSRPAPPGVLFCRGHTPVFQERPCAALVGTRRCTQDGADTAYQLAYDLSKAGVCVVSGLALGIDGAAHAGALTAARDCDMDKTGGAPREALAGSTVAGSTVAGSTVAVTASGVDVAYPRQHRALWQEVVSLGAVVSETPPGWPAQSWRFPSRNRLIAGLARIVVVVECHASGGSWHTVEAALRGGTEVGAVPGPIHSPASVGTNTLLHEGATPIRGAQDILDCLGAFDSKAGSLPDSPRAPRRGYQWALPLDHQAPSRVLGPLEDKVRAALGWRPLCLEEIVERSGLPAGAVVVALDRLEVEGLAQGESGWWSRKTR